MVVKSYTVEFDFGDLVCLKTDSDKSKRIVTAHLLDANGGVVYELSSYTTTSRHYGLELEIYQGLYDKNLKTYTYE